MTAELPSLGRLQPTMTALLPSPSRGIISDAAFVHSTSMASTVMPHGKFPKPAERIYAGSKMREVKGSLTPAALSAFRKKEANERQPAALSCGVASIAFVLPGGTPKAGGAPRRKGLRPYHPGQKGADQND